MTFVTVVVAEAILIIRYASSSLRTRSALALKSWPDSHRVHAVHHRQWWTLAVQIPIYVTQTVMMLWSIAHTTRKRISRYFYCAERNEKRMFIAIILPRINPARTIRMRVRNRPKHVRTFVCFLISDEGPHTHSSFPVSTSKWRWPFSSSLHSSLTYPRLSFFIWRGDGDIRFRRSIDSCSNQISPPFHAFTSLLLPTLHLSRLNLWILSKLENTCA